MSVGRAVDSALAQECENLEVEIVVIDDASTDGSAAFVDELAQKNSQIRLIRREVNGGPGCARNMGIESARGDWIAVLDADDWYAPHRLKTLLELVIEEGTDLIADNQYFVSGKREHPWLTLHNETTKPVTKILCEDFLRSDRPTRLRNFGLLKPVIRRKFLQEQNIRYDEEKGIGEDFYFLLKCIIKSTHLLLTSQSYYYYRTHSKSLSNTLSSKQVLALRIFHDRCQEQFGEAMSESTQVLMNERGRAIDSYIRYKLVVAKLESGEIKSGLISVIADPPVFLYLVQALIRRFSRLVVAALPRRFMVLKAG